MESHTLSKLEYYREYWLKHFYYIGCDFTKAIFQCSMTNFCKTLKKNIFGMQLHMFCSWKVTENIVKNMELNSFAHIDIKSLFLNILSLVSIIFVCHMYKTILRVN